MILHLPERDKRSKPFLCLATSPDGITWNDYSRIHGPAADTQPTIYHDNWGGNYTVILRRDFDSPLGLVEQVKYLNPFILLAKTKNDKTCLLRTLRSSPDVRTNILSVKNNAVR